MTVIGHIDVDVDRFQHLQAFYEPVDSIKEPDQEPNLVFLPDALHRGYSNR